MPTNQTFAEIWPIFDFSRLAIGRHLGFLKFKI